MTFWIFQNDKTHSPPDSGLAPTDPRIELHWSTFTAKDAHPRRMWTGDVAVLGDGNGRQPAHNTILQVHTEATGAGPVYLRVEGGKLFQLGGPTYYSPTIGTWFNLKVAFDDCIGDISYRSLVQRRGNHSDFFETVGESNINPFLAENCSADVNALIAHPSRRKA